MSAVSWIFLAIVGLIFVFAVYWLIRFHRDGSFAVDCFRRGNCIVAGHKGNGKDLFFSYIINKRKEPHYSNIRYNDQTALLDPKAFNIDPNTYRDFLGGTVKQIPKTLEEDRDYYLSDAGIFMPSTYQGELVKLYPSLPLMYALQRHLLNSNFHANVQNLPRLWDKLREQADYYFFCTQARHLIGRWFIQKVRYYETYEAAAANVLPFKVNAFLFTFKDKRQLALKHQFDAQNGQVKYLYILNHLPKDHYDTRYFHSVLYGTPPDKGKKKRGKHATKRKAKDDRSADR